MFSIFLKFFKKIKKKVYKEHVTKYFYENFKKFKIINFSLKKNFNYLNLSINTNEDFNFVRKIIYKSKNKDIGIEKLLTLSEKLRNEKKFNIGVIGLGVGERHIESFIKFGCKVKKFLILIERKCYQLKKYPSIEICKKEDDIFKDVNIDIVSIASYDNYHYQQILKAIKFKKIFLLKNQLF